MNTTLYIYTFSLNLLPLLGALAFIVLAPLVGGLLAGLDRKITARLQSRVGPPLLQPFYDVAKLWGKDRRSEGFVQKAYVAFALVCAIAAGAMFFAGFNILLVIFVLALSNIWLIVAAYTTRSPYASAGAAREIMQVASYEPAVILFGVSIYLTTGSFDVSSVLTALHPAILTVPGIFLALLFVLTIKLRKSPFDLSYSHHAHQEIVKGITTEMSGSTLALVDIMHFYENVLFLSWIGLFFVWTGIGLIWSILLAIAVALVVYLLEILIDNTFPRVKWQTMLASAWLTTIVLAVLNFIWLALR